MERRGMRRFAPLRPAFSGQQGASEARSGDLSSNGFGCRWDEGGDGFGDPSSDVVGVHGGREFGAGFGDDDSVDVGDGRVGSDGDGHVGWHDRLLGVTEHRAHLCDRSNQHQVAISLFVAWLLGARRRGLVSRRSTRNNPDGPRVASRQGCFVFLGRLAASGGFVYTP